MDKRYQIAFASDCGSSNDMHAIGVTYRRSSCVGVIFSTKIKHAYIQHKQDKVRLSIAPNKASELNEHLSLVVVGNLVRPYQFSEGHDSDVTDDGVIYGSHNNFVVLDVTCAALINNTSNQIVYEFR